MSTLVTSKWGFIRFLKKQLKEDGIIAFTQDIHGQLGMMEGDKVKSVPFGFSSEIFSLRDGVGDIVKGDVFVLGVAMIPPDHASDIAKDLYTEKPPNDGVCEPFDGDDLKHLEWIFSRMVEVHGENKNYDYMLKFREILNKL